ncbi:MAG: hypothetical protein ACJ8BW_28275 [Ktedonobacteraceae bacterium]
MASNINPADVLDRRFLRGSRGYRPIHRTPALTSFFHPCPSPPVPPFDLWQRARNPADQGERQLMLDRQSSLAALGVNRGLLQ